MDLNRTMMIGALGCLVAGGAFRGGSALGATKTGAPSEEITPTWETQRNARTHFLAVPGPRGQIVDRHGRPLAQVRVSHQLAVNFPLPLTFDDAQAVAFARAQIAAVEGVLGRRIGVTDEAIARYYRGRGVLPMPIVEDLLPEQVKLLRARLPPGLRLVPTYTRFYPNGPLAGHIVGYCGRKGGVPDRPIENNDALWVDLEGREGLEVTFDAQLAGRVGQMNIVIDRAGKKASEKVTIPPIPGQNVVTTLDLDLQRLAEGILARRLKRGALVVVEPASGDILCMASWPSYNPNAFVPAISEEAFAALRDNPDLPLIPRAFRSSYPPGSTFKVVAGLAALQSGAISLRDRFDCPPALQVGNLVFRNWRADGAGSLDFREALTQSCNTWFYQVGIKTGSEAIADWAYRMGLGARTGIPLRGEADGRVPTNDFFRKTHGRKILDGDVANMSIGQGDILVSPLQMALVYATIANGGRVPQARLVAQVQGVNNEITAAYAPRTRNLLGLSAEVVEETRLALVDVVSSRMGTAGRAYVEGMDVAGKTGTAQWGPKEKGRTAAWFGGFAPSKAATLAFAALYEGDEHDGDVHGGSHAAPLIGEFLRGYDKLLKERTLPGGRRGAGPDEIPVARAEAVAPAGHESEQQTSASGAGD